MNDFKVGIIGQGFVGTALKEAFSPHCKVQTYDKFRNDLSTHENIADVSSGCDAIFVCVPTPMNPDGSCDTSIVDDVCDDITAAEGIIVIKSTVPVGTTQQKNRSSRGHFVFNPEFLMERSATEDFKNTKRVVLGGPHEATSILKQFYLKVFPDAEIIETDSTTAEFVKYITNCFLAVKVSIANEFSLLCNAFGVDYNKVVEYATYDERLGKSHWSVGSSSPDGKLGFGGSCFPKDLNAIISVAESLLRDDPHRLISVDTLKGAWSTNLKVRPEKDWEQLKGRAVT
jgi:nucleotide sugar dehydrogenase